MPRPISRPDDRDQLPDHGRDAVLLEWVRERGAADGVPDGPTVPLINFIERELIDLGIWNRKGEYSRVSIALAINEALTGKIRRLEDDQLDGPLISAVERALIRFGYRTAGTTTPKNE
jgi:hypothetical protein